MCFMMMLDFSIDRDPLIYKPGHEKLRTENRTELIGNETEVTETEIFGRRFGFKFPGTKIITVNSGPALG